MLPLAFWLAQDWVQAALLAGSVLLVLIVELLNSAVEAAVDRVSLEQHELAGRAKDYGSAAVMLALLLCGGIWAAALWSALRGMTATDRFRLCVYCGSRLGDSTALRRCRAPARQRAGPATDRSWSTAAAGSA